MSCRKSSILAVAALTLLAMCGEALAPKEETPRTVLTVTLGDSDVVSNNQ